MNYEEYPVLQDADNPPEQKVESPADLDRLLRGLSIELDGVRVSRIDLFERMLEGVVNMQFTIDHEQGRASFCRNGPSC